ncbi:uncharacterized protein LOC129601506 [Paramacrobiotus metropolitanus]|uniref:uncharacterized protein LOC129601506 n=1 Tax=Paramacrobiotus metropolitanus TaxID=2943436 RepID=UPI00244566B7|nr:uncharacterized protein LOC129601506 [Paramacrobiotus metropolitanus]
MEQLRISLKGSPHVRKLDPVAHQVPVVISLKESAEQAQLMEVEKESRVRIANLAWKNEELEQTIYSVLQDNRQMLSEKRALQFRAEELQLDLEVSNDQIKDYKEAYCKIEGENTVLRSKNARLMRILEHLLRQQAKLEQEMKTSGKLLNDALQLLNATSP